MIIAIWLAECTAKSDSRQQKRSPDHCVPQPAAHVGCMQPCTSWMSDIAGCCSWSPTLHMVLAAPSDSECVHQIWHADGLVGCGCCCACTQCCVQSNFASVQWVRAACTCVAVAVAATVMCTGLGGAMFATCELLLAMPNIYGFCDYLLTIGGCQSVPIMLNVS